MLNISCSHPKEWCVGGDLNQIQCLATVIKHVSGVVQCDACDILVMLVSEEVD